MANHLLEVQNLSVGLPRRMDRAFAVEDVSFRLDAGEILCIIGESGSGKSVTAGAVMGLLPPTLPVRAGRITLGGQDLLGARPGDLRSLRGRVVSIVFQDPLSALNPLMTVAEQVVEVMDAHPRHAPADRTARMLELLAEVGLPDPPSIARQYPFRLSGGQRQRVMIAMALALDPDILIADEPTTALDVTTQKQILELIAKIQRRKRMGVMFITHDFGVVADIADRVVVMEKGRIVEQGLAEDVLQRPTHPYTRRLIAAVPKLDCARPASGGDVVLEARKLAKTYRVPGRLGGAGRVVKAVDDVSFSVRRGETLAVVGESGSGKSTLGRLVMRLIEPDAGAIIFAGRDVAKLPEAQFRPLRRKIQMIFQDPFASLNPRMTVGRILTVGPEAHGMAAAEARAKAGKLLAECGLDPSAVDRYPHEFSGGQRQRIGIARALMFDPEILVADEAVSALDVSIQAQVLDLLERVQHERGIAMIFITHDLRVASRLANAVAVMHRGKIVETGSPEEVFRNPRHAYTRDLMAAIPGARWDAAA